MIFEREIKSYMQPQTEAVIESVFELPTELQIMEEYYQNEIDFLNMVIEYKDALGSVNESYIESIHEGYMENLKKKAKEMIRRFIEFCNKIITIIKEKIEAGKKVLLKKLQECRAEMHELKNVFSKNTIVIRNIKSEYTTDTFNNFDTNIKILAESLLEILKALNDQTNLDINEIKNKLNNLDIKNFNVQDYIFTEKIERKASNSFINGYISGVEEHIQDITKITERKLKNLNHLKSNASKLENIINNNKNENLNEYLGCVNLIISKTQTLYNSTVTHSGQFISALNKIISDMQSQIK